MDQVKIYILIIVYCLVSITSRISAYKGALYFPRELAPCRNPNGNTGWCVPIHKCESLKYVLENRIEGYYPFVRLSQCQKDEFSTKIDRSRPRVCCTRDKHFTIPDEKKESPTEEPVTNTTTKSPDFQSSNAARLVFPDELKSLSKSDGMLDLTSKFPQPPHCGSLTILNRIYGGTSAELTEFSWMVNLEYRDNDGDLVSVCAGSLINKRYVITAAHCVRGKIETTVGALESVRLGDYNTETDIDCNAFGCLDPYQRVPIEKIIVHEQFGNDAHLRIHQHNDLALIRLERDIKFTDSLQPACLPDVEALSPLTPDLKLTVAGWGHNGSVKHTAEKHKVMVPLVDQKTCRQTYDSLCYVADEQMCAGGVFKEDSCRGDSGGPLMRLSKTWILEGIVSFGRGCGLETPGVYTNLRHYLDWIKKNVRP